MGWFDHQIKNRRESDLRAMQKAMRHLAGIVDPDKRSEVDDETEATTALAQICRALQIEMPELPAHTTDLNEQMDAVFQPHGIMRRRVTLKGEWWKDAYGPLLAEKEDGGICALLPERPGCYTFLDEGERVRVDAQTAKRFRTEAVCFYRSLPQRPLTKKDLFRFLLSVVSKRDRLALFMAGVIVMLLGMITPAATSLLLGTVAPSGQRLMIFSIACLLVGAAVSKFLFSITSSVMQNRIQQQLDLALESAIFARVLNLPVDFFKDQSAGELAERINALGIVSPVFCSVLLGTGLTAAFSLGYFVQILIIAPVMVLPSMLVIAAQLVVAFLGVRAQVKVTRRKLEAAASVQGFVFELFSGIQKIKLAGAEKRAFAKWSERYRLEAVNSYDPPFILKVQNALSPVVALLGTMLLYWTAWRAALDVTTFVTFNTAFGMVSGAVLSLAGVAMMLAVLEPIFDMAEPILSAQPELSDDKEPVKRLSGAIELNNVSFKYTEDGPLILDNISLRIKKGAYVAIVGTTGCGKSTLMRVMMGFERPLTGAVYYDGKNIEKIDQNALRRQIGVVMQNSKLFSGDIYSNITISAPKLTLSEAWEAAEKAGIAEDIRKMPMGMYTLISEGSGGVSGGQKQRLMIARAIAPKPKILMFDEATSALDNVTQKQVSDALAEMTCTRVVIAHRLSTIRECDRIIVLDHGKIVEDGTYDALVAAGGFFSELVARQQVDAG